MLSKGSNNWRNFGVWSGARSAFHCFQIGFKRCKRVVSSLCAFSGDRLLFGGASAGSSCASPGRSVFIRRAFAQLCMEMKMRLTLLRTSHRFPSLAEISVFACVQFLLAQTAKCAFGTFSLPSSRPRFINGFCLFSRRCFFFRSGPQVTLWRGGFRSFQIGFQR